MRWKFFEIIRSVLIDILGLFLFDDGPTGSAIAACLLLALVVKVAAALGLHGVFLMLNERRELGKIGAWCRRYWNETNFYTLQDLPHPGVFDPRSWPAGTACSGSSRFLL